MATWIEVTKVEDPGAIYRCLWCDHCQSIRYHKVVRLQICKLDREWLVFYSKTCNGYPPSIPNHHPRLVRECGEETREWVSASQWNWLCKVNAYAA